MDSCLELILFICECLLFLCSVVVNVDIGGNEIGNIEETVGMHSKHEGGMFILRYIQIMDIFMTS